LTHTFLVLVTVGLGHGVYRKVYAGGQRAEKFENTALDKEFLSMHAHHNLQFKFAACTAAKFLSKTAGFSLQMFLLLEKFFPSEQNLEVKLCHA